jgi:hypothetical protein
MAGKPLAPDVTDSCQQSMDIGTEAHDASG